MATNIPINEQELHICAMRDEPFATIYASDSTQITKLDRLCRTSPEMYQLLEDTGVGKKYLLKDKTLISFRSKKSNRILTDEQRAEMGARMRRLREN